ncbi:MAG: stealth family protein [archaeon]|nr:stealth family protein [archaeon]
MENKKIDIVITWVDGSDPVWLREKAKYSPDSKQVGSFEDKRFKDNSLLKYLFRSIEENAPWVNNIYFVTFGHYPEWLNLDCPKLKLVKHADFIPKEYLPTFNSNSIILNLHRIPGLEDQFIYFNDDFFMLNKTDSKTFFKNGKPCYMAVEDITIAPSDDVFWYMMLNNIRVINKNFDKKACKKHNHCKWINLKYGLRNNIKNISLSKFNKFAGFYDSHLPSPYLKSTFEEVWNKNFDVLNNTCLNKFRSNNDITEWTMKYWCYAQGNFNPINTDKLGVYTSESSKNAAKLISNKKYKLLCINDDGGNSYIDEIINAFEKRYPKKSAYEKK